MSFTEQDIFQQLSNEQGSTLYDLYARIERQTIEFDDRVKTINLDDWTTLTPSLKEVEHASERKIDTIKEALFYILTDDPLDATFTVRLQQAHDILYKDARTRNISYAKFYEIPEADQKLEPPPLSDFAPDEILASAIKANHDVSGQLGLELYEQLSTNHVLFIRANVSLFIASCEVGDTSGIWLQEGNG